MGNFLGGDSKQEGGCNENQVKVDGVCRDNPTTPAPALAPQEGGRRRRRKKSRKRKSRNKRKKSRSKRRKRKRSRRRR